MRVRVVLGLLLGVAACIGSTGGDLVTFRAVASGPRDIDARAPFVTGRGYEVTLTRATVHVGAVYLNRSQPISGAQATNCILPGIYVGQVLTGLDVDVLSPSPQAFSGLGEGTADRAMVGEVWLTGGDVTAEDDPTVVLDVAGTARRGDAIYPFEGRLTIGQNRAIAPSDPSLPGSNPLCKQRIVSPIPADITPTAGGELSLSIDPRSWFANVEFSEVRQVSTAPPLYRFADSPAGQPDRALFAGLRTSQGIYTLRFEARK